MTDTPDEQTQRLLLAISNNSITEMHGAMLAGANPDVRDASGNPVIFGVINHCAWVTDDSPLAGTFPAMLLALCTRKADLNLRNDNGISPLNHALQLRSHFCASVLMASGANVHEVFPSGETPLHVAVKHALDGETRFLSNLITKPVDPTVADAAGFTAIDIAAASKSGRMAEVLAALRTLPQTAAYEEKLRQKQQDALRGLARQKPFKLG
ncbi:MAG: hypothetical protein PW788_12665 [Micavibrio sp.]|nr:hypothetical protein [Micavibrio sp.]